MRIIKHSFLMIKKTFNNYLLLSVTAFLSFAIMFGYLIYTDSESYNKYKDLFAHNPNVIFSNNSAESKNELRAVTKQLDKLSETHYYYMKQCVAQTSFGKECEVNFLPSYVWGLYMTSNDSEVGTSRAMINGKHEVSIGVNEALVSERVYNSLKPDKDGKKQLKLIFTNDEGKRVLKKYDVAAAYSGLSEYDDFETSSSIDAVYLNIGSVDEGECSILNLGLVIYTEQKDFVIQQLRKSDVTCEEVYTEQNQAVQDIKNGIMNKYIIAAVLFILLGINLYSSFTNALNDRKFEIGVKRAIGAKKSSIMLQFVIEGFTVMLANTLLSVWAVLSLMNVYKFVKEIIFNEKYIVTINTESLILFVVFTFFLTLIFSLLFAYKSTKVEIVKYLKEEL